MKNSSTTARKVATTAETVLGEASAEYKKAQKIFTITSIGVGIVWLSAKIVEEIALKCDKKDEEKL